MLYFLITALLLGTSPADQSAALDQVRELKLRDQYGSEDSLESHLGKTVVVMVVTAKRLRNIRPWERDLREQLDEVHVLRITDVPEDSPATHERIANKLLERVPDGVSVMIDIERRWAMALGLDTSRPNILLIDSKGALVAAHRGRHSPELAAEVVEQLRAIQAER